MESSGDDDKPKRHHPIFDPYRDMVDPHFEKGMIFGSLEEFEFVVREYVVINKVDLIFPKNDKLRVKEVYKGKCPYVLYTRRLIPLDTVQVIEYRGQYNCMINNFVRFVDYKWLVRKFQGKFLSDLNLSITTHELFTTH